VKTEDTKKVPKQDEEGDMGTCSLDSHECSSSLKNVAVGAKISGKKKESEKVQKQIQKVVTKTKTYGENGKKAITNMEKDLKKKKGVNPKLIKSSTKSSPKRNSKAKSNKTKKPTRKSNSKKPTKKISKRSVSKRSKTAKKKK